MKKLILILSIFIVGSITFAENIKNPPTNVTPGASEEQKSEDETADNEETKPVEEEKAEDNNLPKPDYITVVKGTQIFYYDKEGKFFARDKKINDQTFFYNKTGQLTGKSVERGYKTYYYNSLNKFLGVCDEKECFDSEMTSTGKIPPLPKIKNFVPYIDPAISNPKQEEAKKEEE